MGTSASRKHKGEAIHGRGGRNFRAKTRKKKRKGHVQSERLCSRQHVPNHAVCEEALIPFLSGWETVAESWRESSGDKVTTSPE